MSSSKYRESFVVRVSAMCLVMDKVWHKGEGNNVLIIIYNYLDIFKIKNATHSLDKYI